jgi:hypothetical protein
MFIGHHPVRRNRAMRRWQPAGLLGDPTAKALFEKYNRVNMPDLNLGVDDVSSLVAYLARESDVVSMRGNLHQAADKKTTTQEGRHHHH